MAEIGGGRLLIGGGADGWLYALEARTGEPVWRFQVSVKGLNSPPAVEGDVVYAAHSEENVDGGSMGRVVAIDGRGTRDITKVGELWRAGDMAIGFAAPTVAHGRVYVVDNFANLHALDQKTGRRLWEHSLGTIGRAAPVAADGKLYLTEQNGKVLVVRPSESGAKTLDEDSLTMSEGRPAELWGSGGGRQPPLAPSARVTTVGPWCHHAGWRAASSHLQVSRPENGSAVDPT